MKTLFDSAAYADILRRIDALQPDSQRQWGKMNVSQMLEHTSRALEMAAGKKPGKQMFLGKLIGWMFRKDFVGEKPFSKNGPTGPDLVVVGVTPDFGISRNRLKNLLAEFHALGERGCEGNVHGFFGKMSGTEWGVTQYKHVDHHLRQFGV